MSYEMVDKELKAGTPAELICATCPWDRLCISPPAVSKAEVDQKIEEAKREDQKSRAGGEAVPYSTILTMALMGGRDTQATLCPIFRNRLIDRGGRTIADSIKESMMHWKTS